MSKTESEMLALVRRYTHADRWTIESHGLLRMRQRHASFQDIRHGLLTGTRCRLQANGRWRLDTSDLDGDALTLVLSVDDGVLVITLF